MQKKTNEIRVLIAEDEYLIAEEISRIIRRFDYNLIGVASNGLKAYEMALQLKPDVILMDIKLPKMDGLTASRKILDEFSTSIVILTAHESIDLVEEASQSGIGAYLTKPPKPEDIDRAIRIALARHQDLAESIRLIKELEENKRKLNELNASKDKFFSILAHDLRNPVSAISNFSYHLVNDFESIPAIELKNYLQVINSTAKGLSVLLEELLLWAGLQSNRSEFRPTHITLFDEVEEVINLLKTAATEKNLVVQNNVPLDYIIFADKLMLHTIIRNILSNAIKFTYDNGVIQLSAESDPDYTIIRIMDSGIGIKADQLENLFKIDYHIKSVGTKGEKGTGLGLILCKEMLEKHEGLIKVESEPGKGSTFSLYFPK
jgi:two-component system, sensor histidine kinase and response regulator